HFAEQALAHARGLAITLKGEILLLAVPEVPDAARYGSMADLIANMRAQEEAKNIQYLDRLSGSLREEGIQTQTIVTGSNPAQTIISVSESAAVDLIVLTSHGKGAGVDRLFMGSVAERIVRHTHRLVYLVPVHEKRAPS
ncbi:MAG: universal stress protein, partial [Anaerolineae bacterium]